MIALYPGSFDPVTFGHLDTAVRAARIFDHVVVAVFDRPNKRLLFSTEERVALMREAVQAYPTITVRAYSILTVEYAQAIGARVIVRGLRDVIDFGHEKQIAHVNQALNPDIEQVILMASPQYSFVSSSIVREVATLGGDVGNMVPAHVVRALRRKFGHAE